MNTKGMQKYACFSNERYYQFTVVTIASRHTLLVFYDAKTPQNASLFLKHVIEISSFEVSAIQTDNGKEFIYRYLDTDKISQFDLLSQKLKLEKRFISVATPRYNEVIECIHGCDEREFYQRLHTACLFSKAQALIEKYTKTGILAVCIVL